jgi:3-oxoacyl-[acyl-carrier protein] reductase
MQICLKNQVVVVTGGSRGIGAAAVKVLAGAGARVVFSYRKAAGAARKVAHASGAPTGNVIAVRADVVRMADAKRLVGEAVRRFGRLDILVANAGIWNADPAPIEHLSERQWDEMIDVNLKGAFSVIRYAAPQMIRQRSGRIIVISSTAGQRGEAFHSHYGAGSTLTCVRPWCAIRASFERSSKPSPSAAWPGRKKSPCPSCFSPRKWHHT